ncbi:MAG: hypothetical protein KKF77_11740 [Proteobacteria bacterium]|nr:hypothetical protein [Pseudomonadota bacterium]
MRIKGYGSGQMGGQGQPGQNRERADAFRSRHSIGERLKGRVLRRDPSGLYWVQVGGEELLARLEVQTDPGDTLMFIVRALVPEIRLQALQGDATQDDQPGLVQRFRAAREAFETQAAPLLDALAKVPPSIALRQDAFDVILERDPEALPLHQTAQELLARINEEQPPDSGATALYAPWLLPSVRRQEIVRKNTASGFVEASLSGCMPVVCGGLELRLMSRTGECSLRLMAERPECTGPLQVELAALVRDGLGVEAQFLAVTKLAAHAGAGVLAELLGDTPRWASGGLNTRV